MNFAVLNRSTVLDAHDVEQMAWACQRQLREHLAPLWNLDQNLLNVWAVAEAPRVGIPVMLLDEVDTIGGSLGYHEPGPGIQIFVKTIMASGGGSALQGEYAVSTVLSHELCETVGDPLAVNYDDAGYGFELCDPCQRQWYDIDGVAVSDFVTPYWFDDKAQLGVPFDYLGQIHEPHTLLPGGYAIKHLADGTTQEVWADEPPPQWRLAMRRRIHRRKG